MALNECNYQLSVLVSFFTNDDAPSIISAPLLIIPLSFPKLNSSGIELSARECRHNEKWFIKIFSCRYNCDLLRNSINNADLM